RRPARPQPPPEPVRRPLVIADRGCRPLDPGAPRSGSFPPTVALFAPPRGGRHATSIKARAAGGQIGLFPRVFAALRGPSRPFAGRAPNAPNNVGAVARSTADAF